MKQVLNKVIQDKRAGRVALAQRSFSEKVAALEKLRARNRAISGNPLRGPVRPTATRSPA